MKLSVERDEERNEHYQGGNQNHLPWLKLAARRLDNRTKLYRNVICPREIGFALYKN